MLVGGYFTDAGGTPYDYLFRLLNSHAALGSLAVDPAGTTLTWFRGGSAPLLSRASFELSTDGVIYEPLGQATPTPGGWRLTGLVLPLDQDFWVRARGFNLAGKGNSSGSLAERVFRVRVSGQ